MKKLYKLKEEEKICGVCAGISDITGFDVTIIRIITFILCWMYGTGIIVYFLFALLLPDKDDLE